MKICHCTTVHPRDDVRVLHKQCVSLAEAGHDVILIVADGMGNENRKGVSIVDIGSFRSSRIKRITKANKLLFKKALKVNADIYQLHDPELLNVGKKLKKAGMKVVFDSHEDVPKQILYKSWLGPVWLRKIIANQYNRYEKKSVKKLDGLISVIDEITVKFECKNKVTLKNFPIVKSYKSHVKPFKQKKKQLVYVGSLTHQRGIIECIELMRYLPDEFLLALIGGFHSDEFKEKCMRLPEWNKVDYYGFLKMDEVIPILADSMLGLSVLHPEENYKTSLPTKGFEYIAAGTPVVLSDFEYWRPYFEGCGAFVEPKNSKRIAEECMGLITTEEVYDSLQVKCVQKAELYSWESEFQKLLSFYDKIISDN